MNRNNNIVYKFRCTINLLSILNQNNRDKRELKPKINTTVLRYLWGNDLQRSHTTDTPASYSGESMIVYSKQCFRELMRPRKPKPPVSWDILSVQQGRCYQHSFSSAGLLCENTNRAYCFQLSGVNHMPNIYNSYLGFFNRLESLHMHE